MIKMHTLFAVAIVFCFVVHVNRKWIYGAGLVFTPHLHFIGGDNKLIHKYERGLIYPTIIHLILNASARES